MQDFVIQMLSCCGFCKGCEESSHPDPASRFAAPAPADFLPEMGVTLP